MFATADFVLAGRYHPAVFAVLGAVPVACIAYEHKSLGLMDAAGVGDFAIRIEDVTTERLVALVDKALDESTAIRSRLRASRPGLQQRALRTAELAVAAAHPRRTSPPPLTPMAWMRWDAVRAALTQTRPSRILEIGAGQGAMGWRLAQRGEYVGVEPDRESFEVARQRLQGIPNAEVRQGDIANVASTERFDVVCAFEVLEHIADDHAALHAWREHLSPGGHLLVSVPAHRQRFGPSDEAVGHVRRYDRADLERVLRETGFEVIWVRGYGAGLGHVLEATRNRVLRRKQPVDAETGTARSGRLFQPPAAAGPAVAAAVAPFRALQQPFAERGRGIGYVALAVRADRNRG
jgi:SAM-dependent methyltransferase